MNLRFKSWQQDLFKSVDCSSLGLFRLLFGLLLLGQSFFIFTPEFIKENFILPQYHFPFSLFEFLHLERLSPQGMQLLFLIMGITTLGIATGLLFKISSLVYLLTFSYFFLFDKALYNDHYYLILLIIFLFMITQAQQWPPLNILRLKKVHHQLIPFWQIFILRMQFVIVYFFSAVSKLNGDWLWRAQPLHRILSEKTFFGKTGEDAWVAYLFSYGGLILVFLLLVLLLLNRYRIFTFFCTLVFNLTNHWIFDDIGIFPFLMIAGFVLFLNPDAPRKFVNRIQIFFHLPLDPSPGSTQKPLHCSAPYSKLVLCFIAIYITLQLFIPLRRWLYPGHPAWDFEGCRFSWRLKLNTKLVKMRIIATDPKTGKSFYVPFQNHVTNQQQWLDNMPDMLLQYVHYLKKDLVKIGIPDPIIKVEAQASLNGRAYQPFIDSTVDLTKVQYPLFSHAHWIVPLRE